MVVENPERARPAESIVVPEGETLWCAGFAWRGTRVLSETERKHLQRRALGYRLLGWVMATLLTPLFLAAIIVGVWEDTGPLSRLLKVLSFILVLGVIPPLVLVARLGLRRAAALRRDVGGGQVLQFAGEVDAPKAPPPGMDAKADQEPRAASGWWPDRVQRRLMHTGLLRPSAHEVQTLEVLPNSGLVIGANGHASHGWVHAPVDRTASSPEFATTAAEWVEPVTPPGDGVSGDSQTLSPLYANARDLSPREVAEIRRFARRLVHWSVLGALPLDAWAGTVLWFCIRDAWLPKGWNLLSFLFVLLAAVVCTARSVSNISLARKLRLDVRVGQLVIVRTADGTADPRPHLSAPEEYLPVSRLLWTEAGRPALWRRTNE